MMLHFIRTLLDQRMTAERNLSPRVSPTEWWHRAVFSDTNEQFVRPLCAACIIVLFNSPDSETIVGKCNCVVEGLAFFVAFCGFCGLCVCVCVCGTISNAAHTHIDVIFCLKCNPCSPMFPLPIHRGQVQGLSCQTVVVWQRRWRQWTVGGGAVGGGGGRLYHFPSFQVNAAPRSLA